MAERYATIVTDHTGKQIVSNISLMEGTTPEIRKDSDAKVIKANDDLQIGMVKGGKYNATQGFGFEDEFDAKTDERSPSDGNVEKERAAVAKK
jgi:hypothetical protein